MMPAEAKEVGGRQIDVASAAHGQVFYDHIDCNQEPRGINGPLFTRQVRYRLDEFGTFVFDEIQVLAIPLRVVQRRSSD